MSESFKEYFFRRNPEMKKISELIKEMSVRTNENRDILKDNYENLIITKKVMEKGVYIEDYIWKGNKLEIFEYDFSETNTNERKLFFIFDKKITYVKLFFFEHDNVAYINDVNSRGGDFRRIVPDIYINFILEKYKMIISDNIQTESGFNLYRHMLEEKDYYNINISVLDDRDNKEIEVSDIKQLEKYFGDEISFVHYRFVIRKI